MHIREIPLVALLPQKDYTRNLREKHMNGALQCFWKCMAFVMASLAGPRYPGPHEAGSKRKLQPGGSCLDENFLMG